MNDLARVAVLGTAHTPPSGDHSGMPSDALVSKLPELEREASLLLRAGAAHVLQRAGFRPPRVSEPLEPAPAETLRRASPRLALMLRELLSEQSVVLAEALAGMSRAGLRLPEELLPLALDTSDPDAQRALAKVIGERGRWLGKQRAAWGWASAGPDSEALPADADTRWSEGTASERRALLALARRLAPERGRAWVEATFKADKPEQRSAFLELFAIGLGPSDLPFLESALGDRSRAVRLSAARVLWRAPESSLALELRARLAQAFPAAEPTTPGGDPYVELPAEPFDRSLERLGIEENPPPGVGRRQFWLAQLVSAVPASWFVERFGEAPATLLEAARTHDLALPLLNGWTSAALRFDDHAWFTPLWDAWRQLEAQSAWLEPHPLPKLTVRLTDAERDARMLHVLRDGTHSALLCHVPTPWSEAIGRAFLSALLRRAPGTVELAPYAAACLPLGLIPVGLELALERDGTSRHEQLALDRFLMVIDIRKRLAEEMK